MSNMGFLKELYRLTRFEHAIMLALAVLIGEIILLGRFPVFTLPIILSLLVPMFSEAGSFALNDYMDVETDRINKKFDRPLVRGTISPAFAQWFSIIMLILSTALAFFINWIVFMIALAFNILAILYNWKLKDLPLIGNLYIATTMAIPFIFGNYVVSSTLSLLALILALLGFVSGLAREIVKSVQDMEGDLAARKSNTLPIMIGQKNSLIIASAFYLVFVLLTFIPFTIGLTFNLLSGSLIAIADFAILYTAFSLLDSKDIESSLKTARKTSLVALFIGLIGLLFGAV